MLFIMDVSPLNYKELMKYVSKQRIVKTNNFKFERDRKLSIGSEILLLYGLNKLDITNPIIEEDGYGKPYLLDFEDVFFNISHSFNYVACGISNKPIGVDIEYIKPIDFEITNMFFFKKEYDYILNSKNKNEAFYKIWVLKESFAKMMGLGFHLNPKEYSVFDGENFTPYFKEKSLKKIKLNSWDISNNEYKLGLSSFKQMKTTEITTNELSNYFKF
ncbi:4'-phosphopantetheinyl transferase superfamily protein [Methanobrevibacter sp. OttesenSCG-928-K11]|nr:4'-phosphopantetheinyl transferase superfamily protein [Methanobrevibacter sp. OttesenSCG-928-K11]